MEISEQVKLQKISEAFKRMLELLVDEPETMKTQMRVDQSGSTTFRVYVRKEEAGKLIGKQGRTGRSLRIILQAAGMKIKRPIALDIQTMEEVRENR